MRRNCRWMVCLLALVAVNATSAQDQDKPGKDRKDKTDQPAAGVGRAGEQEKSKAGQPGKGVGRSGQAGEGRTDAGQAGREQTRRTGQSQSTNGDEQIAALLVACNRNEVVLAKFAKDRLKSESAREFADMMIKDHQAGLEKFQKLAGASAADGQVRSSTGTTRRSESTDGAAARTEKARVETDTTIVRGGGRDSVGGQLDWVRIHQEMADECLAYTKTELERHDGEDFDKAYVGQQLGAHMAMVTQLKVLKNHASDKLSGQLDAALESANSHLSHARRIMEEQKKEGSDAASSTRTNLSENRENRKEDRKEGKEERKETRKEKTSN